MYKLPTMDDINSAFLIPTLPNTHVGPLESHSYGDIIRQELWPKVKEQGCCQNSMDWGRMRGKAESISQPLLPFDLVL